jgi:hypothetical protein
MTQFQLKKELEKVQVEYKSQQLLKADKEKAASLLLSIKLMSNSSVTHIERK